MTCEWDRWHDLLDIEDERELTAAELDEMSKYQAVVEMLDSNEAERCRMYLDERLKAASGKVSQ